MKLLCGVNSPEDIKAFDKKLLPELCDEIREFLVDNVSKTGGHLASNLGIVELTVAIHRIFDTSEDRLVFDVGHQSYVHKIITGRRELFSTLRCIDGIAGFPKPSESEHDAFIAGHASNSISVALGMARARTIRGEKHHVIALIGDGALTGGLSYEALSDAGDSGEPLIVILNDNGMSITPNVGGIAKYLSHQRTRPSYLNLKKRYHRFVEKIPGGSGLYRITHKIKNVIKRTFLGCSVFEEMGFRYLGPVDGHNISAIEEVLSFAKSSKEPVVIHVRTKKGKGYVFSENNPDDYHGVPKFDAAVGVTPSGKESFSTVFGKRLVELASERKDIIAVTAAMTDGTGLTEFSDKFPDRFFDVGIAEGHAVSMASGAAKAGLLPVCAIYSTFLQRAYDMLMHDAAMLGLHAVFAVDRAGLVGEDGETHHGVFDIAYLTSIPGMTVMCPASFSELRDMLDFAVDKISGPVAIRYPRGGEGDYRKGGVNLSEVIRNGTAITIVTYGTQINEVLKAAEKLSEMNISAEVIKLGFVAPLDIKTIASAARKTGRVLVSEETAAGCGIGSRIASCISSEGVCIPVRTLDLGKGFVKHGDTAQLRSRCGTDAEGIIKVVEEMCNER